jgi:ketosteroid isomerase-like protein
MRIPPLPALVFCSALAACQTTGAGTQVTDAQRAEATRQVEATVDSLFADMNAGDVDRIYDHYRKSDDFLYVTVNETMESWKTFSSVTRSFYTQHPDVKFKYRIVQTQVPAPNVAVVTIAGSATTSPHLTWTQVWVREDGRWVCSLENEAWPGARGPGAGHPAMESAAPQGDTASSGR